MIYIIHRCLKIEIPSSKSAHKFYNKLGYEYRTSPPVFKEDGSTIMYKYK